MDKKALDAFFTISSLPRFCRGTCGRTAREIQLAHCTPASKHAWYTRSLCPMCNNSVANNIQTNIPHLNLPQIVAEVENVVDYSHLDPRRRDRRHGAVLRMLKKRQPSLHKTLTRLNKVHKKHYALFRRPVEHAIARSTTTEDEAVEGDAPELEEMELDDNEQLNDSDQEEEEEEVDTSIEKSEDEEKSEEEEEEEEVDDADILLFINQVFAAETAKRPCYLCETSDNLKHVCKECREHLDSIRNGPI